MLNDEATVVSGLLVGLNIIDCNMVLKDDDDLDRPVGVSTVLTSLHLTFVLLHHSLLQCYYCPRQRLSVCLSVCLFIRMITQKLLQLISPNLT